MTELEFEELNWSIYTSLADVLALAHQERTEWELA